MNQNGKEKSEVHCKYLQENGAHQRYRSSVTRNTSLTFHQLLNEYTSCSSRLKSKNLVTNTSNQTILQKYGKQQQAIAEEVEVPQRPYISRNLQKEKRVEMDHLLHELRKGVGG